MTDTLIRLTSDDTFDSLLSRLKRALSTDVVLVIPTEVSVLTEKDSAAHRKLPLQILRAIANRRQWTITIIAEDTRLADRAQWFHFSVPDRLWDGTPAGLNYCLAQLAESTFHEQTLYYEALSAAYRLWPDYPPDMRITTTVRVPLALTAPVTVAVDSALELSLDCFACLRTRRTAVLYPTPRRSYCTSSSLRTHPLDAHVVETRVDTHDGHTTLVVTVTYPYHPFIDKIAGQYGPVSEFNMAGPHPRWVRIGFRVRCPQCATRWNESTQSNSIRLKDQRCRCGYMVLAAGTQEALWESHEQYP